MAAVVATGRVVHADNSDFFSSSPGALTKSHGTLDSAEHCNDCHINNGKELSNDKCLGCHDHQNLAARINAGKGFHASAVVRGKKCESCHHEHKGGGYDIMGWSSLSGGQKAFDHELTGWPLRGKHATTDCNQCHKATSRQQSLQVFMGTDRLCGTCHVKDQPHHFEASERDKLACERCHNESVWKPAKTQLDFNHDDRKDARMPLLGSHHPVACVKCHTQGNQKSVFHLPFPKPDNCGNAGVPRQHARRPPVRREAMRVVPLADVQDAQGAEVRSHGEHALRPRPRAQPDQVLRLPHQGARREQADGAVSAVPREGQPPRGAVQAVRRPARVRDVPPVRWTEVRAERVQSRVRPGSP